MVESKDIGLCSVIVVANQGGKLLFATIESVLTQKQLAELIVFDSGNAPDVVARLQQRSLSDARLRIIAVRGEVNFAKACSISARQARSEYLLVLKAGYLLPPDSLSELVNVLAVEKKAMLSSGAVHNYDGRLLTFFRTQTVTPKTTFLDIVAVTSRRQKVIDAEKPVTRKTLFEVASISSACMCIRTSDYKKLSGLDAEFFPQDEELDFSLRVRQVGGRVLCLPSVKITKLPSDSDRRVSIARKYNEAKNLIRYLTKFFATHQPIGTLFVLKMLIMLRVMFSIMVGGLIEFFQEARSQHNSVEAKRLMILALGTVDLPKSDELAKKIVLVTGATSQTGLCVIRRLIASGAAVMAIYRGNEIPYYHSNLRWMKGDLTDPKLHLDGYCVDAVVHCAPLWLLPPLVGMLKNAEAKRILAFSSTSVFFKLLTANNFEKDLLLKLQTAESNLAKKCDDAGVKYTILRPTQIYGVGLDAGISKLAGIIRSFSLMFVYPPAFGRRQPVHVDDLSVAVTQVMDAEIAYGKSYNLSGSDVITYREMLERLFKLYKKKSRIIGSTMLPFILDVAGKISRKKEINGEIARRMNDDLVFFHDDAKRDFAFHPRGFLSGGIKDIEGF